MLVDVRGRAAIDRVTVDRTGSSVVPPCAHLGHGSGLGRRGEGGGGEGRGGEGVMYPCLSAYIRM